MFMNQAGLSVKWSGKNWPLGCLVYLHLLDKQFRLFMQTLLNVVNTNEATSILKTVLASFNWRHFTQNTPIDPGT